MIKTCKIFILLVLTQLVGVSCQSSIQLKGTTWRITDGTIPLNFTDGWRYSNDEMTFDSDSVYLKSGFFYNTLNPISDSYSIGRFPFVYYGNRERYSLKNDSLFIFSNPYKKWNRFKMQVKSENEIELHNSSDTLYMHKINSAFKKSKNCSIKYIKAHIYELGLGLYNINYFLTYVSGDSLEYEDHRDSSKVMNRSFKLEKNAFLKICQELENVNIRNFQEKYSSSYSELLVVELEVGFTDNSIFKTILENEDYPEDLHVALIPIIYGHQNLLYGSLPPWDYVKPK